MDINEENAAMENTIEVYYKRFKEIHVRNKIINNVAWGAFQSARSQRMNNYFPVNSIRKSLLLIFPERG